MKLKKASPEDQALVKELKDRLSRRRWTVERNWWGNILFHLGFQWTVYDGSAKRWRQRKLSPSTPTPITNLFRATLDTVKSAIAQHEPRYLGTPTREDPRAVAAAASVDAQLRVILKEGKFQTARRRMLDWLLLTGNAFQEIVWNDSEDIGMDAVAMEQCQQCFTEFRPDQLDPAEPVCTTCGSPYLQEMADKYVMVPRGEIRFDTLSPFEVYLDPMIEEIEDQPIIMTVQSYTPEQVWQNWGVELDGESTQSEISSMHREGIASAAPGLPGQPFGSTPSDRDKRVIVYRAFVKYHEQLKKGGYIALTSDGYLLDRSTPYPWRTRGGEGKKFFPIIHYRFGTAPGRAWGYSPADDLLPKQYQLNKAESLLTMIMARMANPVWLIPANTNPSRITGDIGVQIEYTPVGQAAPARVPGAEAPQSLVKYITDIRQSFDELSGAFAAIRGRSMGSRTPVGTVQSLQERGFGRWATVFQMLEEGYEELAKKSLEIWRQKATSPRVMATRDAIGGFTFSEFVGADWDDGVDVEVEAGSSRPHTQGEKLQTYMELAQTGILDFQDEAQKIKMLEDVGLLNMKPGVEEDTKAAYKENADFLQWARNFVEQANQMGGEGQPMDPMAMELMLSQAMTQVPIHVIPIVDDHSVHFLTHRRLCMTDEFKNFPPQLQQVMYAHMMQHMADLPLSKINMMTAQAMGQQGQEGAGKPGTGPGNGSPAQASTKEMGGGESGGTDAPGSK